VCQGMFMSFSARLFDVMFNVAHLLKIASYLCVLTGLLFSMGNLFREAEESGARIQAANEALRHEMAGREQAQQELAALAASLEQQVAERVRELKWLAE